MPVEPVVGRTRILKHLGEIFIFRNMKNLITLYVLTQITQILGQVIDKNEAKQMLEADF